MGIALAMLHTTPVTVAKMKALASEHLPGVRAINILDDSLLPDVMAAGEVTASVRERLAGYVRLAGRAGADGVLSCCSSIGEAMEELGTSELPVWRIDAAMAEQAVREGRRIGVIATVASTLEPTRRLVERKAMELGRRVDVDSVVVKGAFQDLSEGRPEEHDRKVLDALRSLMVRSDLVLLAQASMARLIEALDEPPGVPILSSPLSGLLAVKDSLREIADRKRRRA